MCSCVMRKEWELEPGGYTDSSSKIRYLLNFPVVDRFFAPIETIDRLQMELGDSLRIFCRG